MTMKWMKKWSSLLAALVLCLMSVSATAGGWEIPGGSSGSSGGYTCRVKLVEDLATRCGPGTQYAGCGSFKMRGQTVTAMSRAYDRGGVLWVEIEFSTGKGYRRAWTGAKRLDISKSQLSRLPDGDPTYSLGYGTITGWVQPRMGPGTLYAAYPNDDFYSGTAVAVLRSEGGYYMVERYRSNGDILRCWVPSGMLRMN